MARRTMGISVTGIVWYRAESFARVRALMVDADRLPETYEKFLYAAHKLEEDLRRSGASVVRVHLDEDTFPAYCTREGLQLDAAGRNAFASAKAADVVRSQRRGGL